MASPVTVRKSNETGSPTWDILDEGKRHSGVGYVESGVRSTGVRSTGLSADSAHSTSIEVSKAADSAKSRRSQVI